MKNKIITITFVTYLFLFGIWGMLKPDQEISKVERRKLATFPSLELNNQYINKLDKYLLEQFPLREEFRSLKAHFNYEILHKLDNNGIYLKNNYIFKSNYPTNDDAINYFKKVINKNIADMSPNNHIYMLIIPDKNYYLTDTNFLNIDYDYLYNSVNELDIKMIDIRDIMQLEDYYETDTHWRQEQLDKVVQQICSTMDLPYQEISYDRNAYSSFYGVYYGESAMKREPENLIYLTNDVLDKVQVSYLENQDLHTIYNPSKLDGMDSYDVYLDGASAWIEITNDASLTNKELVIFRDSFGSSLTPLLVSYYHKITVIDNRYIASNQYRNMLNFDDQDILFLYSTLIVNSSSALRG